jgi:putative Holliday junction resolvase|uniref:Putative pre-16S rRNA nuclease n=1 Tax=candidate division WOR-3 bacterium TaxID=2052148 RepID=A0A7V3PT53_UNCW3
MPRILCLDYGEKRTGVAVSDETRTIAQSLTTIYHHNETELIAAVAKLVKQYEVDLIVIGLPLSLSGKPSTRSEKIRHFASRLARQLHLPVELFDERLSTHYAEQVYTEVRGHPFRNRHGANSPLDRIAATIILEDYLNWIQRCQKGMKGENQ